MTAQRRAILAELSDTDRHPTAAELHRAVRRRLPRISLGTVYRNLDALWQAGRIRRVANEQGQMRFDARLEDHIHVRCRGCGRIQDLAGELPAGLPQAGAGRNGYRLEGYRLDFFGLCPQCIRESSRDSKYKREVD